MPDDFDYRPVTVTLANGDAITIEALRFLGLQSSSGALTIAPKGKSSTFGPFDLHQVIENPDGGPLGGVRIKNSSGGPVTFTVVTSNMRIGFSPDATGSVAVTIGGVSVTVPVSIAAPVQVKAQADASQRAAAADGAAVVPATDLNARLVNTPHAPFADRVRGSVQIAAVGVVDLVAAVAGKRIHLTSLVVSNDGAADNVAIILDGAAELFRVAVKAGDSKHLTFPVPEHTAAATALRVNVTGATSMRIAARGYAGA